MERLETVRKEKGIGNISEFCRVIGFKNPPYYWELLNADKPFPSKYLLNLSHTLNINLHWFFTGDGPMYHEIHWIDNQRALTSKYKKQYGEDWEIHYKNRPIGEREVLEVGAMFLKSLLGKPDNEKILIVSRLLKSPAFYSFNSPSNALYHYTKHIQPIDGNDDQTVAMLAGEFISILHLNSNYMQESLLKELGYIICLIINDDNAVFDINFFLTHENEAKQNSPLSRKKTKK